VTITDVGIPPITRLQETGWHIPPGPGPFSDDPLADFPEKPSGPSVSAGFGADVVPDTGRVLAPGLKELVEHLGVVLTPRDHRSWPVDRLIHPGLMCLSAPREHGKTTLLKSLAVALARGDDFWLGHPIYFDRDKLILFGFETAQDADSFNDLLAEQGLAERVYAFTTKKLKITTFLADLVSKNNVGIIILDSARRLAGEIIDDAQTSIVLETLESADVPVVVIHHPPKSSTEPAGSHQWGAAYRHMIRIVAKDDAVDGIIELDLRITGNDVRGEDQLSAWIDRNTLDAEVTGRASSTFRKKGKAAANPTEQPASGISRNVPHPLDPLARYAADRPIVPAEDWDHNQWATDLAGPADHENPNWMKDLQKVIPGSRGPVKHRSAANYVKKHGAKQLTAKVRRLLSNPPQI
jgi:hypothetical protein